MNTQDEVTLEGVRVVEGGEQVAPSSGGGAGTVKAGEGKIAQRRASLPLEARQSEFKEMLLERGVRRGFDGWHISRREGGREAEDGVRNV